MTNFLRTLKLALRNRGTLLGVLCTSLAVGLLWGSNIGIVYPFVEVVFGHQSLHEWIDNQIEDANENVTNLEQSLKAEDSPITGPQRMLTEQRIKAEREALAWFYRLRPTIHQYFPQDPFQTLVLIVAVLLVGTVLKNVSVVANMILVERVVQLTTFDLRKQFYRQTLRLDMADFSKHHDSELLSRFTYDLGALQKGLNSLFGRALREPLKMTACIIGACCISWRLLLFSLVIAPPALFLMRVLAKSIKRANKRAMEDMSQIYSRLTETIGGIQTVKAFTMEQFERNRFHQSAKEFFRKAMRIAVYNSLTKPITELLGIGVISMALVAGAYLVLEQQTHLFGIRMCDRPLSVASLLLFYGFLAGVSDPARKLSDLVASIQAGTAAADRIYTLMDRAPTICDPAKPTQLPHPHHKLVFDQVDFAYGEGDKVLEQVSLEIPFGETIAIVGPNGCGKSTLINLIPRFYDPIAGTVKLNDTDVRDLRVRDVRTRLGLVTQNTTLFDDTVMGNIRYGSPNATDSEVIDAAKCAHAHRFIEDKLPDGYQTCIGQGGARLSGGQRQRIALARAMLRTPEILILDEATSQIDIESEQAIHEALQEFVKGRTAIMITHRLSTLTLADRIVVMDAGKIIAVGKHDDLQQTCAVYQRLHHIQFKQSA